MGIHVCECCGKEKSCKTCSMCHKAYYCSRECQVKRWPFHKQLCAIKNDLIACKAKPKSGHRVTWSSIPDYTKRGSKKSLVLLITRPLHCDQDKVAVFQNFKTVVSPIPLFFFVVAETTRKECLQTMEAEEEDIDFTVYNTKVANIPSNQKGVRWNFGAGKYAVFDERKL